MSSDVVIRAEGLGKKYIIGHQSDKRYTALRDVMARTAKNIARTAHDMMSGKALVTGDEVEVFWALKEVSFEINRGEIVGIIGRNGAGKSTLLKVLSRITEPTAGSVEIKGRVGSLLEVGTGFHPELTGRENIYLNGAILGMTRAEIKRKFDEIVDFSGVEKFLDTPVKRYSSGMYVRLAFAVAAHLEPEILIVDEVLAVGDAEFQKKCLGKMQDVAGHGRTVLFVSHNMASVSALCRRTIWLGAGQIRGDDETSVTIKNYLRPDSSPSEHLTYSNRSPAYIDSVRIRERAINYDGILTVDLGIHANTDALFGIEFEIHNELGHPIAYMSTSPMAGGPTPIKAGKSIATAISIGPLPLATGAYSLYIWLIRPWTEVYHHIDTPFFFEVSQSDPYLTGFDFRQSYSRGCYTSPIKVAPREL
jgi:lipopolysaccharide transport system ATP-binding protein